MGANTRKLIRQARENIIENAEWLREQKIKVNQVLARKQFYCQNGLPAELNLEIEEWVMKDFYKGRYSRYFREKYLFVPIPIPSSEEEKILNDNYRDFLNDEKKFKQKISLVKDELFKSSSRLSEFYYYIEISKNK